MTSTTSGISAWPELRRARRAIVVADVVESVRLMQQHEADVIDRWRRFINEVQTRLLPEHGGRLVKSLGDGLLLEFEGVPAAVAAACDLQKSIVAYNAACDASSAILLRVGAHVADIVVDELDVYGSGVNLASRLASLAGPGEIIVSSDVRAQLVPGLDADTEDLGECYVKHLSEPVRAFRVGPVGEKSRMWSPASAHATDRVSIAVIPFSARAAASQDDLLGEALADDLIAALSRLPQLHVVSLLSSTAFRHRNASLDVISDSLGARYVVHGSYMVQGRHVRVSVQMANGRDRSVVWADAFAGEVNDVFLGSSPLVDRVVEALCQALVGAEVQRACSLPLPTLEGYTILLGAIALMHRLSVRDFERSRTMLQYLVERYPRATAPRAWLGKWHVMRVAQGWSPDAPGDAREARATVATALDIEPTHSLALAIDGLVCAYINKDLRTAGERYDAALQANRSEGLAWLFRSAWHTYHGRGNEAVDCALTAQSLSPLDPMKYYYDNFTSTAMLSAGNYAGAIEYGQKSLRANRTHGPTLRILAIAQALADRMDEARATVAEMQRVEPHFTIERFLQRYPGRDAPHAAHYAAALRNAGLPEA